MLLKYISLVRAMQTYNDKSELPNTIFDDDLKAPPGKGFRLFLREWHSCL